MRKEITEITNYYDSWDYLKADISCSQMEAIMGSHYGENHRSTSFDEETTFLEQFVNGASGGWITEVSAIKVSYGKKINHKTGHGQIYYYHACMDEERRYPSIIVQRL